MNADTALVPVPPEAPEPLTPGYYECTEAIRGYHPWKVGQLGYLVGSQEGRLTVVTGGDTWHFDEDDFRRKFRPVPDGRARRNAERDALLAEIDALGSEEDILSNALATFNPHAGDESALVVAGGADGAKRTLAQVRNSATRLRSDLVAKQQALKALAEEQALILKEKAAALQGFLDKAEEAIWTINLYLGTNEEIVKIADGEPASADTPITIRQLVLFMDEECAIQAEAGGIDFTELDAFDEWLTADPAHVIQVLPEQRGIVALKPRRRSKDYASSDVWANVQRDRANRKTYFLIRNGGVLYRMWTDYEVDKYLVPRSDEFVRMFVERHYNWETHRDEEVTLEPGTDAYMRAAKKAEGSQRHYMRAALVLQGLIDRTAVFRPLKWEAIRVNSYESYGDALNLVLDADTLLADGRERFADWQRRINGELAPGQRVVGTWNNWEHGLRREEGERHEGNSRIAPRHAEYPDSDALYTIEGRKDHGGLAFYYERHDRNWRSWGNEGYVRRASCTIYPDDRFILNFDAATEEDLRFFLESRADRPDYMFMLPLIRYALARKAEERAAEAPFRLLLAGQIAAAHGIEIAEAEAALDDLVRWWKFKNRTHRALTSDDSLALRMIVA
jgi:hypothetical protein